MLSFSGRLSEQIGQSNSHLCVGLDIDPARTTADPNPSLQKLEDFSTMVIDATIDFAVAYKLNFGFFERHGAEGFRWMERTLQFIDGRRITIADAKRGDTANSARQYAASVFGYFGFDAVTVSPYMGSDSIAPFAENAEKGVFVLCLTSNEGAKELQLQEADGQPLYRKVVDMVLKLNRNQNYGLVVAATRGSEIAEVRRAAGDLPFLIPGVGAQGGDLETSVREGNRGGVAMVSISRGILYGGDRTEASVRQAARRFHRQINAALGRKK